jgi:hypothetical protein
MSTYFCPRCGKKSSVLLKENQLCQNCMTKWAWGGVGNQVTITPEAVAAHDSKSAVRVQARRTSPLLRILPVVSLVCTAGVIVLLIYFFRFDPAGISGQQVINRFANIATSAVILAGLGFAVGASVFYVARKQNYDLHASARVLGVVSIILGMGVFGTAVFCWSRTERATSLSTPQTGGDELLQRLSSATVVIQAHEPDVNRYRSAKREGVIIANEPGRAWILTVPFLDGTGNPLRPSELWVNLSDGRTLPGQIQWAQSDPVYLAIVSVDTDHAPGQIQFHPAAEAVIPGRSVLVIPNPLNGWMVTKATILSRASQRTTIGWNTVVKTSSHLSPVDVGGAMYDESGRFLGFMVGVDPNTGESQFVIVNSTIASLLEAAMKTKT